MFVFVFCKLPEKACLMNLLIHLMNLYIQNHHDQTGNKQTVLEGDTIYLSKAQKKTESSFEYKMHVLCPKL